VSSFEMWVNIELWIERRIPQPPKNIRARTSQRLVEPSTRRNRAR
jgi:hypothetical protein